MTYQEKLRDPRWQRKRLKILERDNFECTDCGNDSIELHVHHKVYSKGDPWDSPDEHLATLCKNCHQDITFNLKEALDRLVVAIKIAGINANSVNELADAFENMKFNHINEVVVSALCKAIEDDDIQRKLIGEYFENRSKKRGHSVMGTENVF